MNTLMRIGSRLFSNRARTNIDTEFHLHAHFLSKVVDSSSRVVIRARISFRMHIHAFSIEDRNFNYRHQSVTRTLVYYVRD